MATTFAKAFMVEIYRPLTDWLARQNADKVRLSVGQVETIIGREIPPEEFHHRYPGSSFGELSQVVGPDWLLSVRPQQITFTRGSFVESVEQRQRRRGRVIALRKGGGGRYLDAYLSRGSLVIRGQDLGSGTASMSGDGEYEWSYSIPKSNIPRLLELLGEPADANILDVLQSKWTGRRAARFEEITEENQLRTGFWSWSG